MKSGSAAKPSEQQDGISAEQPVDQLDVRIVDAAWQDLAESPTEDSARLLSLLNTDNDSTDIVMPVALNMISKSTHYTLAVESTLPPVSGDLTASLVDVPEGSNIFRPCTQVLGLVESSEASVLQKTGEEGYNITTNNVKDILHYGPDTPVYQLTSFCSLENLQDFKLDPPRSQSDKQKQAALVLISSVLQESSAGQPACFMVDSVQLLTPTDVDKVKPCLKRLLYLTTLAGHMASMGKDWASFLNKRREPGEGAEVPGIEPISYSDRIARVCCKGRVRRTEQLVATC